MAKELSFDKGDEIFLTVPLGTIKSGFSQDGRILFESGLSFYQKTIYTMMAYLYRTTQGDITPQAVLDSCNRLMPSEGAKMSLEQVTDAMAKIEATGKLQDTYDEMDRQLKEAGLERGEMAPE